MTKILIIEDNSQDENLIASFMKRSFDECSVTTTNSLSVARSLLLGNTIFDVIVLDSMLRGFQNGGIGVSLLPVIREGLSKHAILLRFSKNEQSLQEARNVGVKVYHTSVLTSNKFKLDDTGYLVEV